MIKIYIACLASYNAGHLFGKWLDLDDYSSEEDVLKAIQKEIFDNPQNPVRKLYGETPEEWAMHDIEGIDYAKVKTEWPDFDDLIEMNDILNDKNGEIILGVKDHMGLDSVSDAKQYYEDNYQGEFKSWEDFAYHVAEECMGWKLDEGLGRYFDAEAFGRDLSYEHFEIDGHYFISA